MNAHQAKLSTLWIFATLNYLYCDVVDLMDSSKLHGFLIANVGGMDITQQFLLAAGALVEVPMVMVLVSRLAKPRANRVANIGAGVFMTLVQLATLFAGKPTPYYVFFSAVEIAATVAIVVVALSGARSTRWLANTEFKDVA